MYVNFNVNPKHKRVGDCVIRAISKALDQDWETTYTGIILEGFRKCDMPSSDDVWGSYLRSKGFTRQLIPEEYTVATFSEQYPHGTYILAIQGHVVCVVDGDYYDIWDSGDCIPIYFWQRPEGRT